MTPLNRFKELSSFYGKFELNQYKRKNSGKRDVTLQNVSQNKIIIFIILIYVYKITSSERANQICDDRRDEFSI